MFGSMNVTDVRAEVRLTGASGEPFAIVLVQNEPNETPVASIAFTLPEMDRLILACEHARHDFLESL